MAVPEGPKPRRWWQQVPWLWAIGGVGAAALVLFVLWWGPWLFTRHPSHGLTAEPALKAKNDVRTILVQAVAGLAVASGAIVTYRSFRHTRVEQDRAYKLSQSQQVTESYAKAVEQLGHDQAPVRLGAMYALERLAQDNPPRRQTIVDVRCAYLRMPYTLPPPGKSAGDDGNDAPTGMTEPATASVPRYDPAQELQVRQTAQRLLADHLRHPPDISREDAQRLKASPEEIFWPGISLDLTGATLVDYDLNGISVIGATFTKATFSGTAGFDEATFSRNALFYRATFSGAARFDRVTFSGEAGFGDVTFSGTAGFALAAFSGTAGFGGAAFSGTAGFGGAAFSGTAGFVEAAFSGTAGFVEAAFSGAASFDGVTFSGAARFDGAAFSGAASFDGVTFSGAARFDEVRVLHLDNPDSSKGGKPTRRVWPAGWTVRPDADDPTRGTLIRSAAGSH